MEIPAQIVQQALSAQSQSLAEVLGLRVGQPLTAQVVENLANGLTRLAIGNSFVQATLPQQFPVNTEIPLRVVATAPALTLAITEPPQTSIQSPATQTLLTNEARASLAASMPQVEIANARPTAILAPTAPAPAPTGNAIPQNLAPQAQSAPTATTPTSLPQPVPGSVSPAQQLVTIVQVSAPQITNTTGTANTPQVTVEQPTAPAPTTPVTTPSPNASAPTPATPSSEISTPLPAPGTTISTLKDALTKAFEQPVAIAAPVESRPALTRAVLTSVARQDTTATLISRLIGLGGKSAELPPQVSAAVRELVSSPLNGNGEKITADAILRAVVKSGVFHENALSNLGASPRGDIKASLLQLQRTLMDWIGKDAGAKIPGGADRPPPPLRSTPARAEFRPVSQPPQTTAPAEIGRALLSDADAALARTRLLQMASLPEPGHRGDLNHRHEVRLEIPIVLGQNLSMAQIVITPDGAQDIDEADRAWTINFALNFPRLGEIGAQVSLKRKRVAVALWTESEEAAEILEEMQPELELSLEAAGLDAGRISVRHGVPRRLRVDAGQFMDNHS